MRFRGGSQVFRGRGGSRGCRGGRGRATVTRGGLSGVNPTTDHALVQYLEHEEENELDARSPVPLVDKANWNEENTHIFYELCVEQVRAGNCVSGTTTTRGYNLIKEEFFAKTGLKHDRK